MSGSESPTDDGVDPVGPKAVDTSVSLHSHSSPALRLAVVRRDGSSDRATVHPPGLTGVDRMETWLSVDLSAVVELDAWR
jgi:hypothetical protein